MLFSVGSDVDALGTLASCLGAVEAPFVEEGSAKVRTISANVWVILPEEFFVDGHGFLEALNRTAESTQVDQGDREVVKSCREFGRTLPNATQRSEVLPVQCLGAADRIHS